MLFNGPLIVLWLDKESPIYRYKEPSLQMTEMLKLIMFASIYASRLSRHAITMSLNYG
jgi:hypothetical protein